MVLEQYKNDRNFILKEYFERPLLQSCLAMQLIFCDEKNLQCPIIVTCHERLAVNAIGTNTRLLGLLRTGDIKTFQSLHRIHWAILTVFVSLSSHTVLITDRVLCKISFLYIGQHMSCKKYLIKRRTCSQIAVLLPRPSPSAFCSLARLTLITRPKSSLWSMLSIDSWASWGLSNSTYPKPR